MRLKPCVNFRGKPCFKSFEELSAGSCPIRTDKIVEASVTVLAIGPAVSWLNDMGITPVRLTIPTVGFIPTSEFIAAGTTIDPSVSVPIAPAQKLLATATADPELEPPGVRSIAYAFLT